MCLEFISFQGKGCTSSNKIGHGFDDQGSTFDGDGVMRNWWTEEDGKEFKKEPLHWSSNTIALKFLMICM